MQFLAPSAEFDNGAIRSVLFQWVCWVENLARLTNWFYHRWEPKEEDRRDNEREDEVDPHPFVA